jgi:ubiquitin-conjugating enzyme E2 D/E
MTLQKELAECTKEPPAGTTVRLVDESDFHNWEILMDGPEQSIYAVCSFKRLIRNCCLV